MQLLLVLRNGGQREGQNLKLQSTSYFFRFKDPEKLLFLLVHTLEVSQYLYDPKNFLILIR